MPEYVLEIAENNRHVCVERGSIVIKEGSNVLGQVPIDTIATVLLSSDGATCTKHFLAKMGEENIPVIVCGRNYMPVSMALPVSAHYRQLLIAKEQINASPVLKKQLWQKIVTAKIKNQADTLIQCQPKAQSAYQRLQILAAKVRSGDSDNKEGQAARIYWPALMGKYFSRNPDEGGVNMFLNYGYAIVRSTFARAICAAGLLPLLGIHHCNTYNPFCLADDLMEPVRPLMDKCVFEQIQQLKPPIDELTPNQKKALADFLRQPLPFCQEEHTLSSIAANMSQSVVRSLTEKALLLTLPGH